MQCKECQKDISDGNKFCRHCGSPVAKKQTYCSQCGVELKDAAKFCTECGSSVSESVVSDKTQTAGAAAVRMIKEALGEEIGGQEQTSDDRTDLHQRSGSSTGAQSTGSDDAEDDIRRSINIIGQSIRSNPTNVGNYLERAKLRDRLGEYDEAIEDLHAAERLDASEPTTYLLRGMISRKLGHYKLAIDSFDRAIDLDPNDAESLFQLGWARRLNGDPESAIDAFTKAIDIKNEIGECYLEAHKQRGEIYFARDEYSTALGDFDICFEEGFEVSSSRVFSGNCHYELGALQEAQTQFDLALQENPLSASAFVGLGKVAYMNNDYPRSIDLFTAALGIDRYHGYLNWRGFVRYISGDYHGCLEDFLSCIEQDPENWEYLQWCCTCYDALGQYERAKESLDQIFALGHETEGLRSYREELEQKLAQ